MTTTALRAMTNDALDDLLDGLVDGTVSTADPAGLYDAALTERFDPRRGQVSLPLTASEPPANVTAILV